MTRYLIAGLLALLLLYGLLEAWPLISGPALTVDSPPDYATFSGGIVEVRGNAARAANLTLNGALVLHDQNGDFSSTLAFPPGGSILTFVATDRFGRTVTAIRHVFVPSDARPGAGTN